MNPFFSYEVSTTDIKKVTQVFSNFDEAHHTFVLYSVSLKVQAAAGIFLIFNFFLCFILFLNQSFVLVVDVGVEMMTQRHQQRIC